MACEYRYLIGNSWRTSEKAIEIRAPFDGAIVGTTFQAPLQDVRDAIAASVDGFEKMRSLPTYERAALLSKIAAGIAARGDEIARILAAEAGKPLKAAKVEVDRSTFTFNTAAEEAKRIEGTYLPLDLMASSTGRFGIVRRFPIGPITGITPFNFPLNLVAHKIAPALAAGNSIILKPAPQTPLTALILAEIIVESGAPAGAVNIFPCSVEDAEPLITDERMKMLSFTGSPGVGWALKNKAGHKKVVLELGGNAGVVIHSDANLAFAATRAAQGGFGYAGQTCISVQRILVHQPVLSSFLEMFLPQVQSLKLGNPLDEATDVGPIVSEQEALRIESWVQEAVTHGAALLTGGTRQGSLMTPTVLTGTDSKMRVNCQEIFGPVVTVEPYENLDEAIAQVNASAFGLQAGIFTNDLRAILRAYENLDVGGVIIGDVPTYRIDHMPYGGVKNSGFGREGIKYAIEEMTEPKLLVINQSA